MTGQTALLVNSIPVNTERMGWVNLTHEDATDAELHLVHLILGNKPNWISDEQWRINMRACASDIRAHVDFIQATSVPSGLKSDNASY